MIEMFTFKNVIDAVITGVVAAGSAKVLIRVGTVPEGTTAQQKHQNTELISIQVTPSASHRSSS